MQSSKNKKNPSHLRGSFAAATGENRRKNQMTTEISSTSRSNSLDASSSGVPHSLDELLKRAESVPRSQEDTSVIEPSYSNTPFLDGEGSHYTFLDGAKFTSEESQPIEEESTENLQQEINLLQHALINRFRGSQKSVSGCQFRVSGTQKFSKCENCDSRDKALIKAKETIRKLKASQDRSQTTSSTRRPSEDSEALARLSVERDEFARRCGVLNEEIMRLSKALSEKSAVEKTPVTSENNSDTVKDYEQQIQKLIEQNAMLTEVIQNLSDQKDALEARNSSLDLQLEDKTRSHSEIQEKFSVLAQNSENEINGLNRTLKNETRAHSEQMHIQKEKNAADIAQLKKEVAELGQSKEALNYQMSALRDDLETARGSMISEKKISLSLREENQESARKIRELEEELLVVEKQKKVADNEILFSKELIEKLKAQLQDLSGEREKVLQTAISGSVRLCIVAPTVNVHIADKNLKFHSQVPTEQLNIFLRNEILARYTFLFKQDSEDTSPEAGVPLTDFMQKALADMQSTIEGHIYTAMGNKESVKS